MKRFYLIILFVLPVVLQALTLEKGNLKIAVDDETGGYLCYSRLSDDSPWYPLLVESFTSSYTQMRINGQDIIPGDREDFSLRFDSSDEGVALIYEGDGVLFTERVVMEQDLRGTAYFDISLTLENRGHDSLEGGIKKVLDTTFVRGDTHFLIQGKSVEEETVFEKGQIPSSLLSPGTQPGERLYVKTSFEKSLEPDRLLLVNWNRLDRSSWNYRPAPGTNFNALPFSINDSALGLIWQPLIIKSGESLQFHLAMGPRDFSLEEKEAGQPEPAAVPVMPSDPALARLHLEEQLDYIEIFLRDLDNRIDGIDDVSNENLLSLEERLDVLEQNKRDYERLR